ncbi:rna-directed dna polymerase from mobile element jockey-like [Limosa lapponica baueri]|uniref:Rna-directed dna polymerase from mobile element jockey-like n=1 Tax=Limosa lapponica baueri TaxID=1758121 RepID=A0A2I0UPN8_LIMLA|nr:rna-directed dna polymerase from mobile element jockey-like [Limosa lapponica baueri]
MLLSCTTGTAVTSKQPELQSHNWPLVQIRKNSFHYVLQISEKNERRYLSDVKDNKGFFKYILTMKARENVGPLLNEVGALVMEDTEKVELLNAFSASVFTAKASPQESQTLEAREKVWRKEDFPLVKENRVRDHLGKLNTHKSMGPNGMHPQVLRELADVIAKSLSIIIDRSWRKGEVPGNWRTDSVTRVFKQGRKESQETTGQSASPLSLER